MVSPLLKSLTPSTRVWWVELVAQDGGIAFLCPSLGLGKDLEKRRMSAAAARRSSASTLIVSLILLLQCDVLDFAKAVQIRNYKK